MTRRPKKLNVRDILGALRVLRAGDSSDEDYESVLESIECDLAGRSAKDEARDPEERRKLIQEAFNLGRKACDPDHACARLEEIEAEI